MRKTKNALILADLEGVTGLYSLRDRSECVQLMTAEVDVITDELIKAGISNITVCDVHDNGDTVSCTVMENKGVHLVSQFWNLDFNHQYDMALLTGFHAMHGSIGYFPHTFRPDIHSMYFSCMSDPVGEIGFFVSWLARYHIPVVLVTGDKAAADESLLFNSNIPTCTVKEIGVKGQADGISYERLKDSVSKALARKPIYCAPRKINMIEIAFINEDICALLPDKWRKEGNQVIFTDCDELVASIEALCCDLNRANHAVVNSAMSFISQIKPFIRKLPIDVLGEEISSIIDKYPIYLSQSDQLKVQKFLSQILEREE